jgi:hypothetical protein
MAEMTIRLRCDPVTGKKDIIVSLRSDEELLPQEHEQRHRELVEKLIHRGLVKESELGRIVVEREQPEKQPEVAGNKESQEQKKGQAQGS